MFGINIIFASCASFNYLFSTTISHLTHGEKDEPDENTTNTIKGEASITIVSRFVFEIDSKCNFLCFMDWEFEAFSVFGLAVWLHALFYQIVLPVV